MKRTCDVGRGELVALLYGELAGAEATALAEHAESCASCGAALADMRTTVAWLDAARPTPEPEVPRERLASAVLARTHGEGNAAGARRSQRWAVVAAAAAAALVLVLVSFGTEVRVENGRLVVLFGAPATEGAEADAGLDAGSVREIAREETHGLAVDLDQALRAWSAQQLEAHAGLLRAIDQRRSDDIALYADHLDRLARGLAAEDLRQQRALVELASLVNLTRTPTGQDQGEPR